MEKFSSIDRIVGKAPEDAKKRILNKMEDVFKKQDLENLPYVGNLKDSEKEKTTEEIQILDFVNQATNGIRRKYGLSDLNVLAKNAHVILKEKWIGGSGESGGNIPGQQCFVMKECSSKTDFMHTSFHEMLHFKSYTSLQVMEDDKNNLELTNYRVGLTTTTRDGERLLFSNLNEAVTEKITKRFLKAQEKNPLIEKEAEATKEALKEHVKSYDNLTGAAISDEVYYGKLEDCKFNKVNKKKKEEMAKAVGLDEAEEYFPDFGKEFKGEFFSYKKERQMLDKLIEKILEKNLNKFKDSEEVFEIFAKGMMTGNILPIGKLIERSFGSGTFRKIGELDEDAEAQYDFVNSL
ncbi:MAG: hypothetical protein KAQ63_02300 [Candidatus Moranbacteria bacterium]|nr:hypothetical protein [Candidatus Moranbacteria bacterium]